MIPSSTLFTYASRDSVVYVTFTASTDAGTGSERCGNDVKKKIKKIEGAYRNEKEGIFYTVGGRMGFSPDSTYGNGSIHSFVFESII